MRLLFCFFIMIFSASLKAQTFSPFNYGSSMQRPFYLQNLRGNDSSAKKKWSLNTYSSISTGFVFYKGGNAAIVSAPIGLQLTRKLNNNVYAFAGVSVVPSYISFRNNFLSADVNKIPGNSNFLRTNNFGVGSRAEIGLMYVNDQKTFSISGSIGIEKSSYPMFPYNQFNTTRPNPVVYPNK